MPVILPPSALDSLSRLNIQFPMMFRISNKTTGMHTHCGVLEFIADEGYCYIPYWMMEHLGVAERGVITLANVTLQKGVLLFFVEGGGIISFRPAVAICRG